MSWVSWGKIIILVISLGFEGLHSPLPWHYVTQFPTNTAHNLSGSTTGKILGLRRGDLPGMPLVVCFHSPLSMLQKLLLRRSFALTDQLRTWTELMLFLVLLFKNLQERTFISLPSNLVHRFAILTLGKIFLIPNADVPCYDLRLISLSSASGNTKNTLPFRSWPHVCLENAITS